MTGVTDLWHQGGPFMTPVLVLGTIALALALVAAVARVRMLLGLAVAAWLVCFTTGLVGALVAKHHARHPVEHSEDEPGRDWLVERYNTQALQLIGVPAVFGALAFPFLAVAFIRTPRQS